MNTKIYIIFVYMFLGLSIPAKADSADTLTQNIEKPAPAAQAPIQAAPLLTLAPTPTSQEKTEPDETLSNIIEQPALAAPAEKGPVLIGAPLPEFEHAAAQPTPSQPNPVQTAPLLTLAPLPTPQEKTESAEILSGTIEHPPQAPVQAAPLLTLAPPPSPSFQKEEEIKPFEEAGPMDLQAYIKSGQDPHFLRINIANYNVRTSPNFSEAKTDNIAFKAKAGDVFAVVPSHGNDKSVIPLVYGTAVRVYAGKAIRWIYIPNRREDAFQLCRSAACFNGLADSLNIIVHGNDVTAEQPGSCGVTAGPEGLVLPPGAGQPHLEPEVTVSKVAVKPATEDDPVCRDLFSRACQKDKLDDGTNDKESVLSKIRTKIFPRVQGLLAKKIGQYVGDENLKSQMMAKVRKIGFDYDVPNCRRIPPQFRGPSYDPIANKIHFCSGPILKNNSEFLLAQVCAHELSHSIDPCILQQSGMIQYKRSSSGFDSQFALPEVLQCLRGNSSMAAQKGALCPGPGSNGKPQDQIGESFADWMGDEIAPEYISEFHPNLTTENMRNGYSNIAKTFCNPPKHPPGMDRPPGRDPHPSPLKRYNFGLLVQPLVRRQMGCEVAPPPGKTYCSPPGEGSQ